MSGTRAAANRALEAWGLAGAALSPLGRGLIHLTLRVDTPSGSFVLQRVNPIFDPAIHENIRAVTERLASRGLETPRLWPTKAGTLWVDLGAEGIWRLLSFVPGATFDVVEGPTQARAAGALVGRFHAALEGLEHAFVGLRAGVHDTARHLSALREALERHRAHRLHAVVAPLGEAILAAAEALPPLPAQQPRVGHGDLKFNNVRFAGEVGPDRERAVCLVDLDTVGPIQLAHELGDAWRSWCNPSGEDREEARFDLEVFEASLAGYRAGLGRPLGDAEREALCAGPEWVSLELAARFAADALEESYFGWDRERFPGAGEHNLVRARSQWALHQAVVAARPRREAILRRA